MKSYPISKARIVLSRLIDRALAGEPQRVTRHGRKAVIVVSEKEWLARTRAAPTLGALLAQHLRSGTSGDEVTNRPWTERPIGRDIG